MSEPHNKFWTPEKIERAVGILRGHDTMAAAVAAMSRAFGRPVTSKALNHALTGSGRPPPSKYLRSALVPPPAPPPLETDEIPCTWDDETVVDIGTTQETASRGWAPECDWTHPVPEGHRIKGNSTLYNGDGTVDQQWVKSERDSDDPPAYEPVPPGHLVEKVSTYLDGQGKVRGQWVTAPKEKEAQWHAFWTACERSVQAYKGLADPIAQPAQAEDALCTVYPLGDPHIGMLAWAKETGQDFDLEIAERDLKRAVDMLVDRAPASSRAILANLGDFFHAEDDNQRTPTGGNKLDCDTRSAKIKDVGFRLKRYMIDRLLTKHALVDDVNVPGNHDPYSARMLNMWLGAVYEREPRVRIVSNLNPYIYLTHGKNLFGFCHGDGAKTEQLPSIMATDRPVEWGAADFRVWHTGHIHHLTKKEFPGCIVESHRTLAARDAWHSWKGYRSGQSLSGITYHQEWGEITRITVDVKLVRAAA